MSTSSPPRMSRKVQREATLRRLLSAAEQLFAERGFSQVSMRSIVSAAGQGNNSALQYHIGNRTDLVRAIVRLHGESTARRAHQLAEQVKGSADPRDRVASLVLPYTEHLASLGNPSWYARFTAQVVVDPILRKEILTGELVHIPEYHDWPGVPDLAPVEASLRRQAMRMAVVHTCAEQERLAAATGTPADWAMIGDAITDAVTGLLVAPRHPRETDPESNAIEGTTL